MDSNANEEFYIFVATVHRLQSIHIEQKLMVIVSSFPRNKNE